MEKFSDRYGYTSVDKVFQRESVDKALRITLWNVLKISIWDDYDPNNYSKEEKSNRIDMFVKRLWFHYFNNDMDKLPQFWDYYNEKGSYSYLKEYFFTCEWYEIYNFLEELAQDASNLLIKEVRDWINTSLEQHNSAYRFVDDYIAEVTTEEEIIAIESAINTKHQPVREHLKAALRMLSDKESQDFRNSVKESISAVEAVSRQITDNKSATLGDALKKIRNCHPALSQGFQKIYGYTSDESGIRHSLIDESVITYADAKFMLVACSAFVSYLQESVENG
jgi:hypothetical protein